MDFGFFIIGVMLLIMGAFVLLTAYLVERSSRPGEGGARVRGGGVVIIGPVPIIFGSDRGMAIVAAIIGAVLTVIAVITWLIMVKGW